MHGFKLIAKINLACLLKNKNTTPAKMDVFIEVAIEREEFETAGTKTIKHS